MRRIIAILAATVVAATPAVGLIASQGATASPSRVHTSKDVRDHDGRDHDAKDDKGHDKADRDKARHDRRDNDRRDNDRHDDRGHGGHHDPVDND
jgi:hypothetical protein